MELVEGETLAERIARGPIPVEEALAIALQIVEALEAAHESGIIHRDPQNKRKREPVVGVRQGQEGRAPGRRPVNGFDERAVFTRWPVVRLLFE
jgi:hypothetical protein